MDFDLRLLLFLWCTCYCYGLNYQQVPRRSPVWEIPDPKWHSFIDFVLDMDAVVANLTSDFPVLRYCAFNEVYKVYFERGHKRFELLLLLQHTNGEHLVNLTLNNDNIFVNDNIYVKTKYEFPFNLTEVQVHQGGVGFYILSIADDIGYISIGNGDWEKALYEWLFVRVNEKQCFEAKVKVVDGYVEFTVDRNYVAFPTEPYDDVFFSSTTAATTATTTVPESTADKDQSSSLSPDPVDTVHKASSKPGFLYVVGGMSALVASIGLSFLGYRLGRQTARKQALKKGLLNSMKQIQLK